MDVFKKFLDKIFGFGKEEVKTNNELLTKKDETTVEIKTQPTTKNVYKNSTGFKKDNLVNEIKVDNKVELEAVKNPIVAKQTNKEAKVEEQTEITGKPISKTKKKAPVAKKATTKTVKKEVAWEGEPEEVEFTYMLKEKRTRVVVLVKKVEKIKTNKFCLKGYCKTTRKNQEFFSDEILTKLVVPGIKNRLTIKEWLKCLTEEEALV